MDLFRIVNLAAKYREKNVGMTITFVDNKVTFVLTTASGEQFSSGLTYDLALDPELSADEATILPEVISHLERSLPNF